MSATNDFFFFFKLYMGLLATIEAWVDSEWIFWKIITFKIIYFVRMSKVNVKWSEFSMITHPGILQVRR